MLIGILWAAAEELRVIAERERDEDEDPADIETAILRVADRLAAVGDVYHAAAVRAGDEVVNGNGGGK